MIAHFRRIEPLQVRVVDKLRRRQPQMAVIVVGDEDAAAPVVDIMRAGADYYVVTDALEDRLFDALEDLLAEGRATRSALPPEEDSSDQGGDSTPFDGLRDALQGLMALSRDAMSALEQTPSVLSRSGVANGLPWFGPGMSMRDLERQAILGALRECDNNRTRAAGLLKISIRTLHRKIREYELP